MGEGEQEETLSHDASTRREEGGITSVKEEGMSKEIWMPHAGHFVCGQQCRFRLNTYVNGYIVSTVGEYMPDSTVRKIYREVMNITTDKKGDAEEYDFMRITGVLDKDGNILGYGEDIGYGRKYETMVFKAVKDSKHLCCPWKIDSGNEVDFSGYNTAEDAYKGHMKLLKKYSKLKS